MEVTALSMARRFLGVKELAGEHSNPLVLAMLKLDNNWVADDETPWCSAFVNFIAFLLDTPRTHSLAARSWLQLNTAIRLSEVRAGWDVVVLSRGANPTAGHVGFYVAHSASTVSLLGGNQGDSVSVATFDIARIVGIRRLTPPGGFPL